MGQHDSISGWLPSNMTFSSALGRVYYGIQYLIPNPHIPANEEERNQSTCMTALFSIYCLVLQSKFEPLTWQVWFEPVTPWQKLMSRAIDCDNWYCVRMVAKGLRLTRSELINGVDRAHSMEVCVLLGVGSGSDGTG